jgi:outer membrane protein
LSLTLWGASAAQGTGNRSSAPAGAEAHIALVDVAHIFKKYDKFTRLYETMKAEVRQREKEIADSQNELKVLMNKKQSLAPESIDYKNVEKQIVQKKGELELAAENARREFTQKEANLYHQTYQEVEDAVAQYAELRGITLVLRASRDNDSGGTNPQDVIKEVSQMVIFSLPQMDITDAVLASLNAQSGQRQMAPGKQVKPSGTQAPRLGDEKGKNDTRKPSGGTIKK